MNIIKGITDKILKKIHLKMFKKISYKQLKFNKEDKILIISPHPDDEVFYCSGIILNNMIKKNITVLCLTNGKNLLRKKEFIKVMKLVGIRDYNILNNMEGNINFEYKIDFSLYDKIFIPNLNNTHNDHIIGSFLLYKNFEKIKKSCQIYSYEDNGTLNSPTHYTNLSRSIKMKIKLIKIYKTQMNSKFNFVDHIISLNRYRGTLINKSYAEFYKIFTKKSFKKKFKI